MILVTGAGGFIGGHAARSLLLRGLDVRAAVHERPFDPGAPGNLPRGRVEIVQADLESGPLPPGLFDGVRAVVHAAARLPGGAEDAATMRRMNAELPARLIEAASRAGVKRFVHISSGGVLGATGTRPAREEDPARPLSPYERTKWEGELAAIERARRNQLPLAVLRPALVYGPGDSHLAGRLRAAHRRTRVLLDGGRAWCHPVHVSDVAEAICLAVLRREPVEGVFHIAGEGPVRWHVWLDRIAEAEGTSPVSIRLPLAPVRATARVLEFAAGALGRRSPLNRERLDSISVPHAFDISRARRELGWEPRIPLARGIRETAALVDRSGS